MCVCTCDEEEEEERVKEEEEEEDDEEVCKDSIKKRGSPSILNLQFSPYFLVP